MKTAILHVGLHKTGTTSIQQSLRGYDDGDTRYAALGDPNHSHFFRTLFSDDHHAGWWTTDRGLSATEHRDLIVEYQSLLSRELAREHSRLVFSGEAISALDREALQRLKRYFSNHHRQITAIVFVREPLSMTASLMQERVKWGDHLQNENTDGQPLEVRVSDRVGNVVAVFGEESTRILRYEDASAGHYPRGVIDYFAESVGLRPCDIPTPQSRNQSIGETTYKLLNTFFQSDIVHRKGAMLGTARWRFITMLDEAMNTAGQGKLDLSAFRSKVNWEDYIKLNAYLTHPYPIDEHSTGEAGLFSRYCNDIDHVAVRRNLASYLREKAFPAPADCSSHELLCMLFYKALRDDATEPLYRQLHARQEGPRPRRHRSYIARKLTDSIKRLFRK